MDPNPNLQYKNASLVLRGKIVGSPEERQIARRMLSVFASDSRTAQVAEWIIQLGTTVFAISYLISGKIWTGTICLIVGLTLGVCLIVFTWFRKNLRLAEGREV